MTDYKALYEAEVKRRENAETRWNKVMKVSRDSKERIQELEASLQSTENYWKSKYQVEADKVEDLDGVVIDLEQQIADLKEEVDGFRKRPAYAAVIWERDCLKEENEQLKESINRL